MFEHFTPKMNEIITCLWKAQYCHKTAIKPKQKVQLEFCWKKGLLHCYNDVGLGLFLLLTVWWGWLWPSNFLTWIRYTFLEPIWHQELHGICIFFQCHRYQNHYCQCPPFYLDFTYFNSNFVFFEKIMLGSDGNGQNWI